MNSNIIGKSEIDTIVRVLNDGEVVAFPTETVFGLGVKFDKLESLEKIYDLKGRDRHKAVTLMLSNIDDIDKYAFIDNQVKKIIDKFMPGMITLILKKKDTISYDFTAGLDTIGIRIPDDPFVLKLLQTVGPMLVTSANISNHPDLLNHEDVYHQFKDSIPLIVEGKCKANLASTVVKYDGKLSILREGLISKDMLEEVLK